MNRVAETILVILICLFSSISIGTRTARTQSLIASGRFTAPTVGIVVQPFVPLTISWAIGNPGEVDSQDLILSTDGGATFKTKIAAHLPPEQRQLKWGAAPGNTTGTAKLELALHLRTGAVERVLSDDFSIAPLTQVGNQAASTVVENFGLGVAGFNGVSPGSSRTEVKHPPSSGVASKTGKVLPAFANPGSCTTAETPILNYNMNHPTQCASFYNGEPALAQDPTDPTRFFATTGGFAETSSTAQWAFSVTSKLKCPLC